MDLFILDEDGKVCQQNTTFSPKSNRISQSCILSNFISYEIDNYFCNLIICLSFSFSFFAYMNHIYPQLESHLPAIYTSCNTPYL